MMNQATEMKSRNLRNGSFDNYLSLKQKSSFWTFQEAQCWASPTLHQRGLCGEGLHLQISWENTYPMTFLGLSNNQKGIAMAAFYKSAQDKQTRVYADGVLLPLYHRKCVCVLHFSLVLQLHCSRQQSPPQNSQHGPKKSLTAHYPAWKALLAPTFTHRPKRKSRPYHTQDITGFIFCPQTCGTGP